MWPEIKVSTVPGKVEHQETHIFYTEVCFEACLQLDFVCTVPVTSTVFNTYLDVA